MYLDYVNIKMGTNSVPRFSRGNTLPLTQLPFAMASFSPQTERISGQENWFFSPNKPYLEGIRLTHQPSPWIGDYGTILFTPQNGIIADEPSGAWSGYRIDASIMRPDYLKVDFLRSECTFELTPSTRGCAIELSFERENGNILSVLNVGGNTSFTYKNGILYGENDYHSHKQDDGFKMYFVVKFLEDVVDFCKIKDEKGACHIGIKGKKAKIRVAISYLSIEQALLNLDKDKLNSDFNTIRENAISEWEKRLSTIEIEDSEEKKQIFYSCLYRSFLFPHIMHEIDENGKAVHYSSERKCKCDGIMYTSTGFWDTSRTLFPLFSLIAREDYEKILIGAINVYNESGYLPRWHSLSEVGCMPSTLIDSVIADAVINGIGTRELHKELLKAMIKHANTPPKEKRFGREGIKEYLKYGYVPCDLYKESVNLTLDFAYGDFCIAVVAKHLGETEIYNEYIKRADNYKSILDKETGFMRPRLSNGSFKPDFDPLVWGGDYTESSAYQASLFVPHNIDALAENMGGKDKLISHLEKMIKMKPRYRVDGYGLEIHEMTEMAQVNLGQCAISNQPSFNIPYLFAVLGGKEKSEELIKYICENLFTKDAYPGDEDNGSMSAWYILSVLGKYKICPGKAEWTELTPLTKFKINI